MRRRLGSERGRRVGIGPGRRRFLATVLIVLAIAWPAVGAVARFQVPPDYTPATGPAQVIAQGVVELPAEEVLWRTLRGRAPLPADAPFVARPLGFVLATDAPLLLVDRATTEQTRLGPGEGALIRAGAEQQLASLGDGPAGYLALELVPAVDAPDAGTATVLQEGQPFAPTPGLHDLDLVRALLAGDETLTVPDTGEPNVILVTAGAVAVGPPGEDGATLLAGEAATFAGELAVEVAGEDDNRAALVVAVISPEVAPVAPPPVEETPTTDETPDAVEETPAADETSAPGASPAGTAQETGSVTIQVANCPPGMGPESLMVAVCDAAAGDFDVTLSGDALDTTLTLADAEERNGAYTWTDLPFGEYVLAEAVLPAGYESYVVSAADAAGSPETGYTIAVDADTPDVTAAIYNFRPAL